MKEEIIEDLYVVMKKDEEYGHEKMAPFIHYNKTFSELFFEEHFKDKSGYKLVHFKRVKEEE